MSVRPKPRRKKSSGVFMSPDSHALLSTPIAQTSDILSQKKFKIQTHITGGKHSQVLFARRSPLDLAIKSQILRSPKNIDDRAYRELRILKYLSTLKATDYYPSGVSNFVEMIDFIKGKEGEAISSINYVLEKADLTLHELRETALSVSDFREIIFQLFFAFFVGQTEFEFMHNDFHLKNVLLWRNSSRKPEQQRIYFQYDGITWAIQGYLLKLTDFGHSRITVGKRAIYDRKNPSSKVFLRTKDVQSALGCLNQLRINAATCEPNTNSHLRVTEEELDVALPVGANQQQRAAKREALEKEARRAWLSLRKLLRNDALLSTILQHDFFAPLRTSLPEELMPSLNSPPIRAHKRKLSFSEVTESRDQLSSVGKENSQQARNNRPVPKRRRLAASKQ